MNSPFLSGVKALAQAPPLQVDIPNADFLKGSPHAELSTVEHW